MTTPSPTPNPATTPSPAAAPRPAALPAEQALLLRELESLLPVLKTVNLAAPRDAETVLSAHVPPSGPHARRIEDLARAGVRDGWLLPKSGGPKVRFGRLAKDLGGYSVDFVLMEGAAAGHTHTNGEVNLGFPWSGSPRFDGRPPGRGVFAPGSHHVPTVSGGEMLLLYFLPGGKVAWDPPPAPTA